MVEVYTPNQTQILLHLSGHLFHLIYRYVYLPLKPISQVLWVSCFSFQFYPKQNSTWTNIFKSVHLTVWLEILIVDTTSSDHYTMPTRPWCNFHGWRSNMWISIKQKVGKISFMLLAYIGNGKAAAARLASTLIRSALDATATLRPLLLHC